MIYYKVMIYRNPGAPNDVEQLRNGDGTRFFTGDINEAYRKREEIHFLYSHIEYIVEETDYPIEQK